LHQVRRIGFIIRRVWLGCKTECASCCGSRLVASLRAPRIHVEESCQPRPLLLISLLHCKRIPTTKHTNSIKYITLPPKWSKLVRYHPPTACTVLFGQGGVVVVSGNEHISPATPLGALQYALYGYEMSQSGNLSTVMELGRFLFLSHQVEMLQSAPLTTTP
jgi:hypothetical protein